MTAAGRVTLRRRSLRCGGCGLTAHPLDARVGIGGFLSPHATRLACLAAASWSFDIAADRLREFAGIPIDGETIRRHGHRAAGALARRREAAPPKPTFDRAEGQIEFLTDGVMAPTRDGWRGLRMALYLKRPLGKPADRAERGLPRPTAQAAWFRREYNTIRPHSSIDYKTPREFSEECDKKSLAKDSFGSQVEQADNR